MNNKINLKSLLSAPDGTLEQKLALFAWLSLGIIESLAKGLLTPVDAVHVFFNAENSLFVRQVLEEEGADAIMSHGVQLPDLFEALPTEEAQREFQHELEKMRSLGLGILEQKQLAA